MPTIAFCRSMMTRAVFFESRFNEFNVAPIIEDSLDFMNIKYEDTLDFVKFCTGEAATMTDIAEPRRSRRSALEARTCRVLHTSDGKFNAELGSIVWIVLSP